MTTVLSYDTKVLKAKSLCCSSYPDVCAAALATEMLPVPWQQKLLPLLHTGADTGCVI